MKGGVAVDGRRLYVGSYDGHVYALDARTGKQLWRASAQERLGGARARSTRPRPPPTAASTSARPTARSTRSAPAPGELRWSHSTGGYVYGSPAVWNLRVLVGSYSGRFYAFDAATGDVRWQFQANGPISGSATVLGRPRLLLDAEAADVRARRAHRQARLELPGRQVLAGRRRTTCASISSATRGSMRWSRGEIRGDRSGGLHRLAPGRRARRGGPRGRRHRLASATRTTAS